MSSCRMTMKTLAIAIPIPLVLATSAYGAAMMCGGVGSDARRALEGTQSANVELEFFVAQRGAYVANVGVSVTPLNSKEPVIEGTSSGPLCLLQLEPGRYRVQATFNGATRTAPATVRSTASRPVHVALGFPQAVASGDLDTRASPEEKAQAKRP